MIEINGKYNKALVYCDDIEEDAARQIKSVCDLYIFKDQKLRIMPDCHSGKGCVIGFTSELPSVIVPSLIGVDIGCGMLVVYLGKREIDFEKLDAFIRNNIPSGFEIADSIDPGVSETFISELKRICELTHTEANRQLRS